MQAEASFLDRTGVPATYAVLARVSPGYPPSLGRLPTCYSPVRRSCTPKGLTARLACVKHAASVRPEPGSNSPLKTTSTPQPQTEPEHGKRDPGKKTITDKTVRTIDYILPKEPPTITPTKKAKETARRVKINSSTIDTLLSSQESNANHGTTSRPR